MVRLFAGVLLTLLVALPARAEWVDLALPTGEVLKAELALPARGGTAKAPAVIYMHDAIVRSLGAEGAAERGYDVGAHAQAFADRGFVALAPVRRTPREAGTGDEAVTEGLSAILAGVDLLGERSEVDSRRIAVVGFGEGGTIALWALARMPDLSAGVVMSPLEMTGRQSAETLNFERFLAGGSIKAIRAPLLLTVGEEEGRGMRRRAETLAEALIGAYKRFRYIHTYRGDHRWFRTPQDDVMADITAFLGERLR